MVFQKNIQTFYFNSKMGRTYPWDKIAHRDIGLSGIAITNMIRTITVQNRWKNIFGHGYALPGNL